MAGEMEEKKVTEVHNSEDEEEHDEEEAVKWWKYYSSDHQILLVGDGDFSFTLSLSNCFGSASNIVATSFDSYDTLVKKYKDAKSNLERLTNLGATIIHGVDAKKMKLHTDLKMRKFDRIIYNFPHAGFHGKEDQGHLIKMHRTLVQGFFRNASGMLRPNGEVHVNHKTTAPYNHWNLEVLASSHRLGLIECVDFKKEDYPGYNNKRGDGPRCDESFPLGECSTFKFKLFPHMKKKKKQVLLDISYKQTQTVPEACFRVQYPDSFSIDYPQAVPLLNMHPEIQIFPDSRIPDQYPGSYPQAVPLHPEIQAAPVTRICDRYSDGFSSGYPRAVLPLYMHPEIRRDVTLPLINSASNECFSLFHEYFKDAALMFGRTDYDVRRVTEDTLRAGLDRYMINDPKKDINGYIAHLQELHRLSQSRVGSLQSLLFPRHF